MKSVQEVMDEKQFFETENNHWSVSGYIQLVPTRSGDVMKDVESSFTEVSILDKKSGNSIYIPVLDDWSLREALWDFRCEAVYAKHNEWNDAVRREKKYDLFAAYQNALADYAYAKGESDE